MARLIDFMKALAPVVERTRVFESIDSLNDQLSGPLKKLYADATTQFQGQKFKSDFAKVNQQRFERLVHKRRNMGFLEFTAYILGLLGADMRVFKDMASDHFDKQISSESMSFAGANLLQVISASDFVVEYARRNLLAVTGFECSAVMDGVTRPGLKEGELQWLDKYRDAFYSCLAILDEKPADLKAKLASVPDIIASPADYDALEQLQGRSKIDPLSVGVIPVRWNPVFRIRLQIANYQVAAFRALEADIQAIELRLVQLKYAHDGKQNPALEEEIAAAEDRVSDMYYKKAQLEEKYGV